METHSISIIVIIYFHELITQDVANICMHNSVGNQRCFSWLTDNVAHYDFREFVFSPQHSTVQTLWAGCQEDPSSLNALYELEILPSYQQQSLKEAS